MAPTDPCRPLETRWDARPDARPDADRDLDGDVFTVEAAEADGSWIFVVGEFPVLEGGESDGLPEHESFLGIAAPVDASKVAADGKVTGEFIEFAFDGEGGGEGFEGGAVGGRVDDDGSTQDEVGVEEGLEDGDAGAGDGGVT